MNEREAQSDEVHLLEWANVLLGHRYLIVLMTIAAGAIAFGLCRGVKPLYESEAKLVANRDVAQLARLFGGNLPRPATEISDRFSMSFVSSYYLELMQSDLLLRPLARRKWVGGRTLADLYEIESGPDGSVEQKTLSLLRHDLIKVIQNQATGILTVRATTINPRLSAELANGLVGQLQVYLQESHTSGTSRLLRAAEERTSQAQAALEGAQKRLNTFRKQNRTIVTPEQQLELEQLQMQVDVEKDLYVRLHTQVELLRLSEQQASDLVEVIQSARVPIWKSWPPTKAAVAGAAVFGFLLAVALAFARSGLRRLAARNAPGCEEFVRHIRSLNWILPGVILLLPAEVRKLGGRAQGIRREKATSSDEVKTP